LAVSRRIHSGARRSKKGCAQRSTPHSDDFAMVREARQRRDKDPDMEYAVGLIASGKPGIRSSR